MNAKEQQELEILKRLKNDFPYFAEHCLRIRTKDGKVLPFGLKPAQVILHDKIEDHKRRNRGKVRVIILKGRQMGGSTYVQGRFYHRLWGSRDSLKAYILTHEGDATDNLFNIAKRYHEYQEYMKPPLALGNAKELKFAHNNCEYAVATAGSKEAGRSSTIQLFHGSEVAFWPNADNHVAASAQAVADMAGTEMILESTANGIGNFFHRMVIAALKGESEYEVIFMPWFWDDSYVIDVNDPQEVAACARWVENVPVAWHNYAYDNGLNWPQAYWAYKKNRTLATSIGEGFDEPCWKFKQEFPANIDEAFQGSGAKAFIPSQHVQAARKAEKVVGRGPVILGIDPSRSGDKVGIIDRCGNRMGERIMERLDPGGSIIYVSQKIAQVIDRIQPKMVNIDVGGVGAGVYDWLMDQGYGQITTLTPVNFGAKPVGMGPTGDRMYKNRRAEMYDNMREWFNQDVPVQIPDDDLLQTDICAAEWGPQATRYDTGNILIIEDKDKIKQRLGSSPDIADAAALTFAVPHFMYTDNPGAAPPPLKRKSRHSGY